MDINTKPGTKVTVTETSIRNGLSYDEDVAREYLKIGGIYTILTTNIEGWHTDVWLVEIPDMSFNSVSFEDID